MINGRDVPFEFTLLTYQTETGLQASILLKECLEKIGVICNVKPTEFTVLVDAVQNRTSLKRRWAAGASASDPDTGCQHLRDDRRAETMASYSNPQVDELFEKGRREFDPKKRAAIYRQIHKLMWEDQPYTWLFYRNSFYAFNKKLRGYNFSATGPYLYDPGMMSLYKPLKW